MIQKIFVAALVLLSFNIASAQIASVGSDSTKTETTAEEKKPPVLTISGSVDGYYKYDFAKTTDNSFTSFTQTHHDFSLGMASIKFEHKGEKVSAVADLGFGPRAKSFSYTDDGITQAIKQLYVSYSPTDWLKFTLGTWATHVGYELLDPQLNRNYSMSYMFTNGPFSHTGLKAEISKGKTGFMLGVSNATDFRIPPADYIDKKFLLAQFSYAVSDNVKFYLNYVGGENTDTSKGNQFDAVFTAKVNDKFTIGYNGTISSIRKWNGSKNLAGKAWSGNALYLNFDPKSWFGLTLRGEYFSDKNHLKILVNPDGCNIFATTLSASFKSGGFTFIPEFRIDNSNKKTFIDKNGAGTKSTANFLFAAVYTF